MKSSRDGLVAAVLLSIATVAPGQESAVLTQGIEQVIRESEYHVSWQDQTVLSDLDSAWQAPNRAQNLRFFFTDRGLRVVDRTAEGSPELLKLAVAGRSTGDSTPVSISTSENRLEISRGGLTESFVNGEAGLQHIMTINEAPAGDGNLEIEFDFSAAGMSISDNVIELRTASGRRLTYSIGEVLDASGEPVSAELGVVDGRILLSVAKSDPVMPVIVKNLLTGAANTVLQGNAAGLSLGTLVSVGDVNGDGFADVVVGAYGWDGGQTDEGAVLVFHGGPGGIDGNVAGEPLVPNAIIESDLADFFFPTSLAVIGDVDGDGFDDIAVGGPRWDPVNPPSTTDLWGAVWVFEGSVQGISATSLNDADTRIVSNVPGAAFGVSVNSAGDVNGDGFTDLIAGGWLWSDDVAEPYEGAGFIFHGSSSGISATSITHAATALEGNGADLWSGLTTLGLGDVNGDGFDDVAVYIQGLDNPELNEGGIAILHGGSAGIPGNPTQALAAAADSLIEANLVNSYIDFAGAGDVNGDGYADLILGMPLWEDSGPHADEGVMLIYHGGPSGIPSNQSASVTGAADTVIEGNPSPQSSIYLGDRVMSAGDVNGDGYADVVAGASRYANGEVKEGAVFVFHGQDGRIPSSRTDPVEEVADVVIEGNMADLYLGGVRTGSGDVNGDGYSDLIIPAPQYDSPEVTEGAVFIYHGGADDLADEPGAKYDGQIANDWLGSYNASAGDVNGDGFSDLVVGVPDHDAGTSGEGRVHVFLGSLDPSLAVPHWTLDGQFLDGHSGVVASAGDVNGDGYGDLVVGTPELDHPETDEGRVDVFHGSATGLSMGPDWFFESDLDDANLGWQVASAGDVNGDGYGDLIVGAPAYSNGQASEGRAYVFFGSSEGLAAIPGWTFESDLAQARFGDAVSSAGDVNGDGFADVIVGAPGFESGHTNEGAAFGFLGSIDGLPDVPNWIIETNRPNSGYGERLTALGDVNGDGFGDVAIGALLDDNPEFDEGRVYIYHGSPAGLSTSANRVLERNFAGGLFGAVLTGAGDVNGDGFADLIVGSPGFDCPALSCGRAYLFVGSALGIVSEPAWVVDGSAAGDAVGIGVAGIGDHNGDGFSDVVVGVPGSDVGAADGGSIELYLGNGGAGRPVLAWQSRGGGDPTPVQPWGLTHSGDSFQVSMTATSPRGRELAKIHVEACPPGEVWGHPDCRHVVSSSWTPIPLGTDGAVLTEMLSGLTDDVVYHWRAHVLYLPFNADQSGITEPPVPRHGPWRTLFAQAPAADIRVGEPQQITIELVAAASTVAETALQAEINVVVTTSDGLPTEIDCSVDFDTYNHTAFAGEDYVLASWNLLFPSGTADGTAQAIPVDLLDDALDEPDEDFIVEISNPFGALVGPQSTHTVTILDDDLPPELSTVDIDVNEGAGLAVVVLELSAPTSFEVTVSFSTADGTATASGDYSHIDGTALIAATDIETTVEIPITEDWIEEGNESFTLGLSSPSNASLTTSLVTITIIDNDAGIIFADGFEWGDFSAWSSIHP